MVGATMHQQVTPTSYTETDPIFIASPAASITGGNITNWNNNMLPAGSSGQTLRHDGNFWASTSNLYNDGTRIRIGMVPNNDVLLDIHGGTGQPFKYVTLYICNNRK